MENLATGVKYIQMYKLIVKRYNYLPRRRSGYGQLILNESKPKVAEAE